MMKESFLDRLKRMWFEAINPKDFLDSIDPDLRAQYKQKLLEEIKLLERISEAL